MTSSNKPLHSLLGMLALLVVLALVPLMSPSYRLLSLAISAGINVVALYGLAVLFGQTGILSMGHAALVGVGAYTAAMLLRDFDVGFWIALPCAGLFAALAAAIVGIPSLRVSGHHFVIMTFAFGQLLTIVLTNGGEVTGAATGISILGRVNFFGIDLGELSHYYVMVVAFVALAATASWAIIHSRYGRTLRAIRENEKLAAAIGINVGRYKIGAFVVSGFYAGVSGVLLAYFLGHISPQQFAAFPSIYLALMVMIGGAESLIVYGICLIAVILFLPNGLIAGLAEFGQRLLRGLVGKPPAEARRDAVKETAR